MSKYRKKPVVIEAMRYTGTPDTCVAIHEWCGYQHNPEAGCDSGIYIDTLEGQMRADVGDWIIRGVQGEFYPCKPDIFEATYEAVMDEASRAPQPTEDERRIPGFAERERGAQAAWEFFARDDRDMSHDFRAGYHQGTIDEARRRAPAEPAVTDEKLRTRLECAEGIAREVLDLHKGEISTHYDSCWKRHAGCLAALILDATALTDIAPAELETGEPTDAQVGRALDEFVSKHDEMGESLTDAMRAALRAAFATRGTDDEQ